MKTYPLALVGTLGLLLVSSTSLPATEILTNGSFDSTANWTVIPEQSETWTCIAGGEANLHPPTAYTGTLLTQTLAVANAGGRRLMFSGVMTKSAAPTGATIAFVLEYLDTANAAQQVTILNPNNDTIAFETALSAEIVLPLGAKTITGFRVDKTNYGSFSLQNVSLDLTTPPIAITSPTKGATFDTTDTVTVNITLDSSITGPRSVRLLNQNAQLAAASPTSFIHGWKMSDGSIIGFQSNTMFNYVHEDEYFFFDGSFTGSVFTGNFSVHSIAGMANGTGTLNFSFDANGLLNVTTSGDSPLGVRNLTGGKSTSCTSYRLLWKNPPAGTQMLTAVVTHTDTTSGKTYILASLPVSITVDSPASPEIAVQEPLGTNLTDGSSTRTFGSPYVGREGTEKTFTIKNTGTATLSGLAISKNGTHAADFTVGPLAKTSLAAGTSTTFTVTFQPGAAGTRTAAIHIASNDADEDPFDISLTGTGLANPEIAVEQPVGTTLKDAANTTNFGTVTIASGKSKTYTIRNKGKGKLTGLAITLNGTNPNDFIVTQPLKTNLLPDTYTTFRVTFKPRAKGTRAAAIHIKSNDADENPFDIKLTGIGANP